MPNPTSLGVVPAGCTWILVREETFENCGSQPATFWKSGVRFLDLSGESQRSNSVNAGQGSGESAELASETRLWRLGDGKQQTSCASDGTVLSSHPSNKDPTPPRERIPLPRGPRASPVIGSQALSSQQQSGGLVLQLSELLWFLASPFTEAGYKREWIRTLEQWRWQVK